MDSPDDEAVALHLSKCLGEHLLTDAFNQLAETREPQLPMVSEDVQDHHGPLIGYAPDQLVDQSPNTRIEISGRNRRRVAPRPLDFLCRETRRHIHSTLSIR